MTKKELLKKIERLERRVGHLEYISNKTSQREKPNFKCGESNHRHEFDKAAQDRVAEYLNRKEMNEAHSGRPVSTSFDARKHAWDTHGDKCKCPLCDCYR